MLILCLSLIVTSAYLVCGQVHSLSYHGNQLMFFHERKTYDQSRLACQQINSDLVIIRDAKLQNFISPYLDSSINATIWVDTWRVGYWIGGTRQANSSTWYWWDGSFLSSQPPNTTGYNNWFGIEPNGAIYYNYCIFVTPYSKMQASGKTFNNIKGGWVDDSCDQLKYYICKTGPYFTNPCLNNGSCVSLSDNYKCNCKPGFGGSRCEKDLCTTTPCKNGGTCSMVGNNYTCSCVKGFFGKHCENDICSPSPCKNGGTCSRISNHFNLIFLFVYLLLFTFCVTVIYVLEYVTQKHIKQFDFNYW
uniref:delta-like protein 1 isoform X1 n=2 Tax=Ciona intestinalis TaxID=7719 RepID=UPI000EF4546C|nr:delta-like protein 1 isoform X1 [Ciona intestinalis]|eukprot:XP_026696434.1 delta-like protein 1 isoform X1 [Ciona intestinalis]